VPAVAQKNRRDQDRERDPTNNAAGDDGSPLRRGHIGARVTKSRRDQHVRLEKGVSSRREVKRRAYSREMTIDS
jgi:hypothetical protein